ncbi:hypothetical protein A3709_14365 [Halioglobus sp. HI00S01]|uniref:sigma 54-interacting transcriptional regulator n=1 Tax=Halioglobus sp. HI00S01 TaxID=1822214 RepID=UPI0007C3FC1C|nr:sigma 54-interacting transcriptional regulator [Halioglobus sp. HI00S01]KZX59474.1 hypothetical protein A3709_14365 [Halioglobus sp. HI00S01]
MPDPHSDDATLPSLDMALPGLRPRLSLIATIVFHPDLTRVGEYAVMHRSRLPVVLGRETLDFQREPSGPTQCLAEPYVSRRALSLEYSARGLHLQRDPGASRCRVNGVELDSEMALMPEQLTTGVAILLAHTVVLWLAIGHEREPAGATPGHGLVGGSAYSQGLRQQISTVAAADMDILLRGATGTGKEVLARAIYAASERSGRPLVTVNMAAIPASLAPSALFGASRGAYTGADKSRRGYFQQAAGGTLFLDEIGDTPAEIQPQLLRALQEREIQPVGGDVEKVELRVISATDADVDSRESRFNAALRHRLAALEIVLRPLRAHREDLGELLGHFLRDAFYGQGRASLLPGPDSTARQIASWANFYYACLCYTWPGNIRQLQNACRQVAVASRSSLVLPTILLDLLSQAQEAAEETVTADAVAEKLRHIAEVSDEEFARAMHDHGHEVRPVARSLNVSRQAVYRKIASDARYRLAGEVAQDELEQALERCGGNTAEVARQLEVSASGLRARLRQEQVRHPVP